MAAKTLKEAIALGLCSAPQGQGIELATTSIANELRDFFSHEVQRMELSHGLGLPHQATPKDLFDKVFANIPAFKK
jgi:hypothetical protein